MLREHAADTVSQCSNKARERMSRPASSVAAMHGASEAVNLAFVQYYGSMYKIIRVRVAMNRQPSKTKRNGSAEV